MSDKLTEIGRCYGMEMNMEKTKVMRISRQPIQVKIMVDQKQLENVESFKYLGSIYQMMEDVLVKLNVRLLWLKLHSTRRGLFYQHIGLGIEEEASEVLHLEQALYGAETWTLGAVDQKLLESFEMWCQRRMEKISWINHVGNEEVLLRVTEQRNIPHEIGKRKATWIGHILRRNCLLQGVIEGKIKGEQK